MKNEKTACHNRVSKYVNQSSYDSIKNELSECGASVQERYPVTDIIFSGSGVDRSKNSISEKYIIRCEQKDDSAVYLIKESSNGSKVKQTILQISLDTAVRIAERSTKWLCSSLTPLIREMGLKMTTNRLSPDTVMRFERERFTIGNKLEITADSSISLNDYDSSAMLAQATSNEPVDSNVCLLQVNYERIIPDDISAILGIN